jgi:FkbM family methyltransferase
MANLGARAARTTGRFLMRGPRRRRLYDALNGAARRRLGGRIRSGPAAGLRFAGGDTAGYLLGFSEPAVQQALVDHLHAGGVLYDVGANAGFVSVLGCRLVGPTGEVHCFEPVPENLAVLRRNLAANGFAQAVVHPLAVSDRDGEVAMVADGPTITARIDAAGGLLVPSARLDGLGLPPPTVVKIDVEGAESRVLAGMRGVLERDRPVIVVEIHGDEEAPVREILASAGYRDVVALADAGMSHLLARP